MTTELTDHPAAENIDRVVETVETVQDLIRRLTEVMWRKTSYNPGLDTPDPELFQKAAQSYWTRAVQEPLAPLQQQTEFWGASFVNFADMQQRLLGWKFGDDEETQDKRFTNPLWDTNPYLKLIKRQYLINAEALETAVASVEDLSAKEKQRLTYFTRQIVNLTAPNNFLPTNPDALEKALETDGTSLVRGLENLVKDLEANDGNLVVKLADETAFELGQNIATTPGDVVYRNRMMELIQYRPATDQVFKTPIVLFPPWINKFYILDLKAQNSLIKWITEQGYTLFVVSWVNPDETHANIGLEDYIEDGYLSAIREAKAICGAEQVNAVGYCIAGTTLSLTLSLLKQRGDASVKSATFFTALTDFSDQGEFTPFLQDDFVDAIEEEVEEHGVLRSHILARTFSFLRSNDLVYGPAIRSYMMGETPPAFDLLYWNGDGANLPAKMAVQYLRGLCQGNGFAEDGFDLMGHRLCVADVDVPLMAITCETDHIAAWKDCYRGVQKMGSVDKTFVVSESGHIAGIVNPPSKKKYGHYTNPDIDAAAETWLAEADYNEGSWWPRWEAWLRKRSGPLVDAREPGDADHPRLAEAPGTYVRGDLN